MNGRFVEDLKKVFGRNNLPAEDAAFISIDKLGTDVRVRHGNDYSVQRLGFDEVSRRMSHSNLAISPSLLLKGCHINLQSSCVYVWWDGDPIIWTFFSDKRGRSCLKRTALANTALQMFDAL